MTAAELETIVLPKLDLLLRVAQRMVTHSADAEDLVGSTLAIGFQKCSQCDGRFPIAWLLQVMRHERMRLVRQAPPAPAPEVDLDTIVDASAHHRLLDQIHQLDIVAALNKIPEEYRLAVTLCDMEEFDYAEAAHALGVPIGTVRSRLYRGRKMLQALLVGWSA